MRKLFLILMTLLACTWTVQAQTRTYHGTVLDASNNEPLVGATIMPIGGGQGVAADVDGQFTLTVPANVKKATVSYVGYVSEEVDLSDGMTVYLKSGSTHLDEMIVVAYGTAKKSAFTGSAAVVGNEEIEKSQATNALNAMNGKVAGVQLSNISGQPGANDPTIYIRGISSINAGNSPLIVVNGAPYPGDLNNINPADIESMTVLKDAASNALYGARGANGVILITTKKGKVGQKATVTLDAKWGANSRAAQEYNVVKDPRQYYEMYYTALNNFAQNQGLSPNDAYLWANQNLTAQNDYGLRYQTYSVPEGQYLIGQDGKFNPYATPGYLMTYNGVQFLQKPDDWLDAAFKTSLRQEYNVSISNASQQGQFYVSANYLNNEGITPNSGYERFTSRLTADTQALSWLKVGGDLSYTHYSSSYFSDEGSSGSTGNIFAAATQVAPIYPLYIRDADGKIRMDSRDYPMYDYSDGANAGLHRPIFDNSNAISNAFLDTNKYEGNAFSALGTAEIRFLKDFRLTSNNSVDFYNTKYTNITNPFYGSYASSNGILSKEYDNRLNYTFQQLLNWEHTFGVNNVAILLGHENYWNIFSTLYATKSNMFSPDNDELNGAITEVSSGSYTTKYNNEGWLFRAQYNYDEKYFASGSFRRDASSRFAPEHRWGNFWSLGGAWIISKEHFMLSTATWLDLLKIKISYGEQGNDNISNFLYTNTYNLVNSNGELSVTPATKGNRNISWEKNGNLNYGIEFELFQGRLTGSIEGFWRKTTDMLSWFPLPPSYGWTGYWDNVGNMENKGVEIDLQGVLVRTKDINWSVNFNLTTYKNKISYLPDARKTMTCDGVDGYSSGNFFYGEGQPLYTYRMYRYAGVDQETGEALYWHRVSKKNPNTDAMELTGELEAVPYAGLSSSTDYFLCGSTLPTVYGGFGTSLSLYGVDIAIDFSYSAGGKQYDGQYATFMSPPTSSTRGYNFHKDLLNAWSPTNTNSNIPHMLYGDNYAVVTCDRFLTSSNYLSLNTINVGYNFPQKWVSKLTLSNLRLYFAADNVWYWSKRKGLDPRMSITGGGGNATYYSPIRTLSGGLQITF